MTRNAYFVDAGIWKGYFDQKDQWNQISRSLLNELFEYRPALYTSVVVVLEFITLALRDGLTIERVDGNVDTILGSSQVEYVNDKDVENSRQILFRFKNLGFSGVDATSIAIMGRLGIKKVLTVDAEFAKTNLFYEVRPTHEERRVVLGQ